MGDSAKISTPYFESIRLDGTKTCKSKIWLERFQQYTEKIYETDLEPMIKGIELKEEPNLDKAKTRQKRSMLQNTTEKKTIFGRKQLKCLRPVISFKIYFIPSQKHQHRRGDFFWVKQQQI